MFQDESSPDNMIQLQKDKLIQMSLSKKPYMPPELIPIHTLSILNNLNDSGDGDTALAHS